MKTLLLMLMLSTTASAQDAPPAPAAFEDLVGIVGVDPAGTPPTADVVEALTVDIAEELRCPVCQGLSVADSQTETAVAMFDRIRELVRLGYTEQQIDEFFIGRYGEWVLLAPRATGFATLLWALPILMLLAIPLVLFAVASARRQPAKPQESSPSVPDDSPVDPYLQRVLADLEDS
ncbi:MAG: cytochrome c-type biogenesis protein CcmH [Myxococcota bacterium]|jgi:cytochrome c-type biogenesis protein CcmH